MSIKVTNMGGETKTVEFKAKMTVADALKAAQVGDTSKATVSVDGKKADLRTALSDGNLVVVTPRVSNG